LDCKRKQTQNLISELVYHYSTETIYMPVVCFLLSNTPASEIQKPGNYPEEHGESLKSRIYIYASLQTLLW